VLEEGENAQSLNDYSIRWNHRPETRGNSSFSASVNAATQSFTQNNNIVNQDFDRSISTQFASNVSYSQKFQGTPFNMSANLRHTQNLQTGVVALTLPDFTLNMNRIYPFQKVVKSSKSPLAKLNLSHNFNARNELTNAPKSVPSYIIGGESLGDTLAFNANNLDQILQRSRRGSKHTIPISTSLNVLKYFTLNPNFNYQELWYTRSLDYTFNDELNGVEVDTLEAFSRAGSWTTGASLNTRIYGTATFKKGPVQAVRHVMTPSVSFSYNPDFSDPKYGIYSDVQTDTLGTTRSLSKFEGFTFFSIPRGESKSLSLTLANSLEMKVASKKDSAKGYKKISLLENFGINTGYNFAADSFQLRNIGINARTSLFDRILGLNFTGTIDPYLRDPETNNRIQRYAWNNGSGLGQLTQMNVALNFTLAGKRGGGGKDNDDDDDIFRSGGGIDPNAEARDFEGLTEKEREELEYIANNPDQYIDFAVPWSLRMAYSVNRSQVGFVSPTIRQSLRFSGSLGLTEKTQITFDSGYDFEQNQFTTTRIGVARDLHCWTLDFNWVPFGPQQSYFVSIRVKSSLLQDLKVEKRRSFLDFFN
jgi:hypothetical protein